MTDHQIERRRNPTLTQEQLTQILESIGEEIAERAAEKALEKMEAKLYQQVGRSFINKFAQFTGAVLIAVAYYLNSKGFFKIG